MVTTWNREVFLTVFVEQLDLMDFIIDMILDIFEIVEVDIHLIT